MVNVILVGNPNTGKTTLFNSLTKSSEHVGNWHGVTVDEKNKIYSYKNQEINLIDLPGIYSLTPLSFEEKVAVDFLYSHSDFKIINICDKNNIQRNLYLTLGLIEKGFDVVFAINEIDKNVINKIDISLLSRELGIDVVEINAEKKINLEKLNEKVLSKKNTKKPLKYLKNIDFSVFYNILNKKVDKKDYEFFTIKLLENDDMIKAKLNLNEIEKEFLKEKTGLNTIEEISNLRYGYIEEISKKCIRRSDKIYGENKLDKILLNKCFTFPIFLIILLGIFYLTFFSFGKLLSNFLSILIEDFVGTPIVNYLIKSNTNSWVIGLFEIAIIGGVGSIISFLPQVALLFFFLSILEDSGYLSRLAFVFEDILSKVGLSGKSVYTLLMGFGCSTTAVMTARNMEDKNSKIKTVLLCPYMSCSAKFPIYAVIGGAFFGKLNIFYILGLYLLGVVVAILLSFIYEKTILKSKEQSFILEFPPYRVSSIKRVSLLLWKNIKDFIVRVGSIIIAMNVIIWILSNFSFKFTYLNDSGDKSMLESLGRIFAPIFSPLGFGNWAIVASLIAGLIAKEIIVTSIAMFNKIESSSQSLISSSILESGAIVYFASKSSVISFLVFCLLYFPCIATMSMMKKEIGFKWTLFAVIIQFFVAYIISFVTYNILFSIEIFGFFNVFLIIFVIFSIILSIFVIRNRFKNKYFCLNCNKCLKNKKCKK